MALADRAETRDNRSKFEKWIDLNTDANKEIVLSWLRDSSIGPVTVARWLREDDEEDGFVGYPAATETVSKWRSAHGIS